MTLISRSVARLFSFMAVLGAREPGPEGSLRKGQSLSGMALIRAADFGALGDGIHDDGPAITAAFKAAKADGVPSTVAFRRYPITGCTP